MHSKHVKTSIIILPGVTIPWLAVLLDPATPSLKIILPGIPTLVKEVMFIILSFPEFEVWWKFFLSPASNPTCKIISTSPEVKW